MDIGSAVGRGVGVTEPQLRELPVHKTSAAFSALERVVLDYAVEMTMTPVEVSDELFAALTRYFNEPQQVELTATIAWENYRARFDHAFRLEAQGFSQGSFCALPERPKRAGSPVARASS